MVAVVAHPGRRKAADGIVLGVEEVGRLDVRVALLVAGVDRVDSDSAVTDGVPSSSTVIAPLNCSKSPRTLLTIRWRTEKPIDE